MSGATPVRILTVCTHNRTRSVMMAALLESLLAERLGVEAIAVRSSGFVADGLPPIDDAVAAMRRRGLDVSQHRSRITSASLVHGADLVVTAEREHVVRVASLSPSAFARTMTLPELLDRAAAAGPGADSATDLRSWSAVLTDGRTAGDYLRAPVPEVADPTGVRPRAFEQAVVELERRCTELAVAVAAVVTR